MVERGWGRIVNISSVNGEKGQFGQTNYSAAKAGMHGFTMALAQEVANKGVTVNTVSPGYIGTEMVRAIRPDVLDKIVATIPVKRLGTPEEIASMVSWVASDALELHASLRHLAHTDALASADTTSPAPAGTALLDANPWQVVRTGPRQQLLVGGSWTGENQIGLLAEAWYDGGALSKASWRRWAARNQGLPAWVGMGAPAHAVAGNLAWQASAFSTTHGGSLHRLNLYVRLSWAHEGWQPALDLLFHPADRGSLVTASLAWQGDRVKLEGGVRVHAGPSTSVVRQLPVRRQAYLSGSWAF